MILIDPVLLVLCVSASICIGLICNFLSLISKWVPNKETRLTWGQWDLNPRPPAPQAYTSFTRDGILDQARR